MEILGAIVLAIFVAKWLMGLGARQERERIEWERDLERAEQEGPQDWELDPALWSDPEIGRAKREHRDRE